MVSPVSPLNHTLPVESPASRPSQSSAFSSALAGALDRVEHTRATAASGVERFLAGEGEDLHTVALDAQRAELEFELALQVRNKVVQAYQEIMRMQV